ncbi:MAG: metallophosphoesterase family protein [Desulfocapsaceae bacterium]|jgi:predicted phosphodiesterase|nr:metallophosphoesterase family protein [Desulfocapsaceae bacterium]
MRFAILSDIHGNYRALEAVLEDLDQQQIDTVITLGDNIGYGPEPEQVVRELIKRNIASVMGNHELALVAPSYYSRLNFLAKESLDISRSLLSASSLSWLADLEPVIIRSDARFCHGCPPASITKYLYSPSSTRLTRIFQSYPEAFCFAGHTHMLNYFEQCFNGNVIARKLELKPVQLDPLSRYLIVAGSVGQPRDTLSDKAKYGIWDSSVALFQVRQVAYDVEMTIKLLKKHHFPPHNANRLKWSRTANR